jgi:cytochrome P450/acetyl esterase/lipase
MRALLDVAMDSVAAEPEGVTYRSEVAGDVPALRCIPPGAVADRVILYTHGGGYFCGSAASLRKGAGHLALACGMEVLSIDYDLAPEHPNPAQVDSAVRAFRWLREQGYAANHIAVSGDSAGGGLCTALVLKLRELGEELPAAVMPTSPWYDLELVGERHVASRGTRSLLAAESLEGMAMGLLQGQSPQDPIMNPLYADLTGFPPTLIHVGTGEPLLSDSESFAQRAEAAGVDVTLVVDEDLPHIYVMLGAGRVPEADAALARMGAFARDKLGVAAPATGCPAARTIELDRHGPGYRIDFVELADELHARCPVAWNTTHGGHWFASGAQEVFDIARNAELVSSDHDTSGTKRGYMGVNIPPHHEKSTDGTRGGFLEMDPPEQRAYRTALNPYLSPAAAAQWKPVIAELTRACVDEHVESGEIDFVEDLANVVPAVVTMGMLGLPLRDWTVYCEVMHAGVYTRPDSPEYARVLELAMAAMGRIQASVREIRDEPRPGLIDALLTSDALAELNPSEAERVEAAMLLMGGGFDTITALTANVLEWLSQHPDERERLSRERDTLLDSATEEFLRYFTPAQGDGRTIQADGRIDGVELGEGQRLWLSWALANRDPSFFEDPHAIHLDRSRNRHFSFGIGIHRCIGSNVARSMFKGMLTGVLDMIPDFACTPGEAVHYDTTGIINGMKRLPATFTPGRRSGPGLEETIDRLQQVVVEQRLAEPPALRGAARAQSV